MYRVSTNMSNDDMSYWLRIREHQLNHLDNQMGSQTRLLNLRDDPIAASHAVRFESRITRLNRYQKNVNTVIDTNNVADGYLKSATEIMQRVREIAVEGANGTFTKSDLNAMGQEVNQLLDQLVQIANARTPDGTTLFAGERDLSLAFRSISGVVPGASREVLTNVDYTGTIGENMVQIGDGSEIQQNLPGNRVFWAEQQQIISNTNATSYVVQRPSQIAIDGHVIDFAAGDNVAAIIAKINNSGASVKASLDPVKNSLVLSTTEAHQIWLRDVSGNVLEGLGVLSRIGGEPPHNIATDARVSGGSLFDMVIALRNDLYQGDSVDIGGSALKGIDEGLNNLLSARAELGSINERLKGVSGQIAYEIPVVQQENSRAVDLDITKAITELKMLEYTHTAALQTAARILPPTLLDFLR